MVNKVIDIKKDIVVSLEWLEGEISKWRPLNHIPVYKAAIKTLQGILENSVPLSEIAEVIIKETTETAKHHTDCELDVDGADVSVWCSDWHGQHVVGKDCEIFYTKAEQKQHLVELTRLGDELEVGWIKADQMPDYDGQYLVFIVRKNECGTFSKYQRVIECFMNRWVLNDESERVTHWMALPSEPGRTVKLLKADDPEAPHYTDALNRRLTKDDEIKYQHSKKPR